MHYGMHTARFFKCMQVHDVMLAKISKHCQSTVIFAQALMQIQQNLNMMETSEGFRHATLQGPQCCSFVFISNVQVQSAGQFYLVMLVGWSQYLPIF